MMVGWWRGAHWALLLVFLLGLREGHAAEPSAEPYQVQVWRGEWTETDFSRHSVPFDEIISGGPPRDGIPPIDAPRFVSVAEAAAWVTPGEPVLVYRHGGEVRAYPLQILIWHEIVNDVVGGQAVAITFCPLCNAAVVFSRQLSGRLLTFGTTGKLRKSDLIMWDRQTHSWWQQIDGKAIVGEYTGTQLAFLPSQLLAFATYRDHFPAGRVLARPKDNRRDYGRNPYAGYDNLGTTRPFLFEDAVDKRLPAMTRVVALEIADRARAYPFPALRAARVVHDTLGGQQVVIFFAPGVRSALDDAQFARAREVGTVSVFAADAFAADGPLPPASKEEPVKEGSVSKGSLSKGSLSKENATAKANESLRFRPEGAGFIDQHGTRWNFLGEAIAGPGQGQHLRPLVHGQHFAFAWLAFKPQSEVWKPADDS